MSPVAREPGVKDESTVGTPTSQGNGHSRESSLSDAQTVEDEPSARSSEVSEAEDIKLDDEDEGSVKDEEPQDTDMIMRDRDDASEERDMEERSTIMDVSSSSNPTEEGRKGRHDDPLAKGEEKTEDMDGKEKKTDGDPKVKVEAEMHKEDSTKDQAPSKEEEELPKKEDSSESPLPPPTATVRRVVEEEQQGIIRYEVARNNGNPRDMMLIANVKALHQRQLPKMPGEYIARLVFDRGHQSLMIVTGDVEVLAAITFRVFPERGFAEIVFLAVSSNCQVKVSPPGEGRKGLKVFPLNQHLHPPSSHTIPFSPDDAICRDMEQGSCVG